MAKKSKPPFPGKHCADCRYLGWKVHKDWRRCQGFKYKEEGCDVPLQVKSFYEACDLFKEKEVGNDQDTK